MRRKIVLSCILIISMLSLTGCWNYREINDLSIVAGVAIDINKQGKYMLTVEIVDLHESGKEGKIKSKLIESYGDTVFDAVRNVIKVTAPKLYWGHTAIAIISQDVAQDGLLQVLDWFERHPEIRLNMDLIVSKEDTAKEILDIQTITTVIRSYELNQMLELQASISKIARTQVYEFVDEISSEGMTPVLPAIHLIKNVGEVTSKFSGTAVFDKDKLVGFIDDNETKSLLFIRDKIKGGMITLKESPESEHANISLEILKNKTKVTPIISNENVTMNIDIKSEMSIDEHGSTQDYIDKNGNCILTQNAQKLLEEDIQSVVKKVQKKFGLDIFGFGNIVYTDLPSKWKEIKPEWKNIFKDLDVNVNSTISIKNAGLISKPIKMED